MDRREILKGAGSLTAVLSGIGGASTAAGQQPQADVRIIGTNEPLRGGERFDVHARITNDGFRRSDGMARLIVGNSPDQVDQVPVTLSPSQSRTFTLGYRTYEVQTSVLGESIRRWFESARPRDRPSVRARN